MDQDQGQRSSNTSYARSYGVIIACLAAFIGLVVGLVGRRTQDLGGADCGSVLGGGGEQLTAVGVTACDRALSTPTTWTIILFVVAAVALILGLVLHAIRSNSDRARGNATA